MPYSKGEGKTALAIFVDGLDVKFVHITLRGKQFHLEDFKTVNLVKKLEERQVVSEVGGGLEGVDLLDASANAPMIQEGVAEDRRRGNQQQRHPRITHRIPVVQIPIFLFDLRAERLLPDV